MDVFRGVLNFVENSDGICSSGQPTKAQFSDMAEQGFGSVINLALPDSGNAIPNEGELVTAL